MVEFAKCGIGPNIHKLLFTEVRHRPPEIVLGICQINFTTASVGYMRKAGLIYFNVNLCARARVRVILAQY